MSRKLALKQKSLLFLLVLLLFSGSIFSLLLLDNNQGLSSGTVERDVFPDTIQEQQEYWEKRLSEDDATLVYDEFHERFDNSSYTDQHTNAHLFGELLYYSKGIEGIKVCDTSFAFGCYHGFMIPAIAEQGVGVIDDLDRACIEKWGLQNPACQHGIGHGLVTFLGYDLESLDQALEACSTLSWKNPIGGCTSGVFMEFNAPTNDHVNIGTRTVVDDDYHYPCQTVDENYRQACYFEQVQWWNMILSNDFKRLGRLCSEAVQPDEQVACYQGIGNMVPFFDYSAEKMIEICSMMPDPMADINCREGVWWHAQDSISLKNSASKMCEGLDPQYKETCLQRLRL